MIERLHHYFSTYKVLPGEESDIHVGEPYDASHAHSVIAAAIEDYKEKFQ